MWCSVRLLSSILLLGLHFSFYGSVVLATTTESFKIPYRCPEAMYHCGYDGQCYNDKDQCVPETTTESFKIPSWCPETMYYCEYDSVCYINKDQCVPVDTSTPPYTTDDLAGDTTSQREDSTMEAGTTEAPDLDLTTESDGETTPQDEKSTDLVTKPERTTQPLALDQTTDDQVLVGSTESVVGESTSISEAVETTTPVVDEDPKNTKAPNEVPPSSDHTTADVTLGRTTGSNAPVTSPSLPTVTSDQSTSSTSTISITTTKESTSSSLSSTAILTTSSHTSSTPITTALTSTSVPSSTTTVNEDVPIQTTSIKPTAESSNSVILVFKGLLANPYHFNATLVTDLSAMLNETFEIAPNPFILRLNQFGPKNSTIITEVSAVQFYTDENFKTVSRVVPSTEILSALSGNITDGWMIADLEFVCGYPSKDKPCVTLPLPYKPKVVTTTGLFESNKDLFIAIFVLASLFLLILVFGLIYLRIRQKRCSSYETNNVKLEKAKLTSASEVNPEVNSPLSDKEILKGEMETSLSQNGAPPLDKDAGWIIPLDQILDNRKNSSSTDTKL